MADDEELKIFEPEEHLRSKAMWGGALKPVNIPDLKGLIEAPPNPDEDLEATPKPKHVIVPIVRPHTPAMLKSIDEICVNAEDHYMGCRGNPPANRVTKINIGFEKASGMVLVENDGPGIPITLNEQASAKMKRDVYRPEIGMSWVFAGTNLVKEINNVKGGINGLGAKVANANSSVFNVETVSVVGKKRLYYLQQFRNRLRERRPPLILDLGSQDAAVSKIPAERRKPHTRVWFVPAYEELGYRMAESALGAADAADLEAWLRLRAHQVAAYVGAKCRVTFNGEECATRTSEALARLVCTGFGEDAHQAVILSNPMKATADLYKPYPWDVSIIVFPPTIKGGRNAPASNMTIINGVVTNSGTHLTYIKKLLTEAISAKVQSATKSKKAVEDGKEKKLSVTDSMACVRIVLCGALPGADWTGQRKDELQVPIDSVKQYAFTQVFLKKIATVVSERVLSAAMGKKAKGGPLEKYTKARKSKSDPMNCSLIGAEGDSAISFLRKGLTLAKGAQPARAPTFDWNGIMSLQGVFLNAHRQVTELETSDGATVMVRSARMQSNKVLQTLVAAWGLDFNSRYGSAEERARLKYGRFIICTDQDLDGIGKIDPLTLVFIFLFWPELIRAGCVMRFNSPVIRAYPKKGKGPAVEFFYESEFERWLAESPAHASDYRIKYYKGLAYHDDDEIKQMFRPENFRRSLYTYTLDDGAKELFNVYYGPTPALRKTALSTPVLPLTFEQAAQLHRDHLIPVSMHLDIDAKAYKLDAIKRQIPHVVDFLNPARRKVIYGAIRRWAGEAQSKELKVFQLGGFVADKCFYHHGDTSLNGTIVNMAQAFPGARHFPYLIGIGRFGDRHGNEAGSARYIAVRPSPLIQAILPAEDMPILRYTSTDGEQAEPEWFVPVVPMGVLESLSIPSEGWNHDSFARDLDAVLKVVQALLAGDPELTELSGRLHAEGPTPALMEDVARLERAWPLPVSCRNFTGEVRSFNGEPHSFGDYHYEAASRTIIVSELPIGVQTNNFLDSLTKVRSGRKENARLQYLDGDPHDHDYSSDEQIRVEIKLKPGAYEKICEEFGSAFIDPIEDFLLLRESLRPHLNYYSERGTVLEFGQAYLGALLYWFPARRDMYRERLDRARILLELKILEHREILRYIPMAQEIDLFHIDDEERAVAALTERKFVRIDDGLLHRPGFTRTEDLRAAILTGPGADYNHILSLQERELIASAVTKREKKLRELEAELKVVLAQLGELPFAGVSVWRGEIASFLKVVDQGLRSNWTFK